MLRSILVILFIIKATLVWGQSPGKTKAMKELAKQRWDKSKSRFTKMLTKDSLDVEGYYIKSLYYFSADNPACNLDTAYVSVNQALYCYESLTLRQRQRLEKIPLDSALLRNLRKNIDSVAFVRVKSEDTEAGYTYFLQNFPTSVNYGDALHLLHEAAYLTARQENTYQVFDSYLKKYPRSHRAVEAQENYDRLLYEAKTSDRRLATYRSYLFEYPKSPYAPKVEEQILEISTAGGDSETFRQFVKDFPQSPNVKKAIDILYYLERDDESKATPVSMWSDSLINVHQLNRSYLVPFIVSGHFGFMDHEGTEVIPASVEEIDQQYLCGNIVEDVLVLDDRLLARNGSVIFQGSIAELDDLGYGYLLLVTGNGRKVILHKSGFEIKTDSPVQDARLLMGQFMTVKCNGHWSLYTLTGRLLFSPEWEEIKAMGPVLGFKKNSKWHLLTAEHAALVADQFIPDFSEKYDDVIPWTDKGLIGIKRDTHEGLLDERLEVKLPLREQSLKSLFAGIESQRQDSTFLYDNAVVECGSFEEIRSNQYWVSTKLDNKWRLYAVSDKSFISPAFDSISFKGIFAIGHSNDSIKVYFDSERFLDFKNVSANFIATRDSSSYLLITKGNLKSLYNARAEKLFESTYDNIQFADKGMFVVVRREKKGLVSESGKLLLPVNYDAIGDGDGQYIPLLRNMKFGLYDLQGKAELKPLYDKNLRKYNQELLVAFRNGSYGLIDKKGKSILPFGYEDIRYWNDSLALVKTNSFWQLFDLKNKNVALDNIKDFKFVAATPGEKIAIVRVNNNYGVLSTTKGVIIPISFTDIINVGSSEHPLYFTEKHVEEASIYVVIYYDRAGKLLRSYTYDPDEYEKIYCSNN